MRPSNDRSVGITENGRSGAVVYNEPAGSLSFYWEFGGGDVAVIVQVNDGAWNARTGWLEGRRVKILRFVGDEVVRQKAPGCIAEIDEAKGVILLRQGARTALPPAAPDTAWVRRYTDLKMKLGLVVLVIAVIVAGMIWIRNTVLVIDPGKGAPVGSSVRTDEHIATLIQTLEPYTPSLNRNHGNDTYTYSLFLVPLDGSQPKVIPVREGMPSTAMGLAKILGSDGHTLWFDVNGAGGVDQRTLEVLPAGQRPAQGAPLQGAHPSPFPPSPDDFLSAGFITGLGTWLGLHSPAEVEREYAPKKFVRRVVRQEDAKEPRRFHRGVLEAPVDDKYYRIISLTPIGDDEYLNAAFLRLDDTSEPLRLSDPDAALMIFTSDPGLKSTLILARVDTEGKILWKVDTGIDRFKLLQILPGTASMAFVGTRPPVQDKVSEPLLVIVDNIAGSVATHSLWR